MGHMPGCIILKNTAGRVKPSLRRPLSCRPWPPPASNSAGPVSSPTAWRFRSFTPVALKPRKKMFLTKNSRWHPTLEPGFQRTRCRVGCGQHLYAGSSQKRSLYRERTESLDELRPCVRLLSSPCSHRYRFQQTQGLELSIGGHVTAGDRCSADDTNYRGSRF